MADTQRDHFFISNHEMFWLAVADAHTLRLRFDGYWWAPDHPTWGRFVAQITCPPPIVDDLVTKGLLHGIVGTQFPQDELEEQIKRIRHLDEAGKAKFNDDFEHVDVVWPTAAGLKWSRRINWPELRAAIAEDFFTLFRRVG
jgi:hypothetical protein